MATIQYTGWLFKDDGTAVDGASVQLYEQGSTTTVGSAVTTGDSSWADGYWEITTTQEPDSTGEYYAHDVKITSGSSVRWLRGKTRESFAEVDIRNATSATQGGLLVANNANTASNKIATFANRRRTGVDGDEIYLSFEMLNDNNEIHEFARITAEAVDSADGNEDGQIRFGIADGDKGGDAGGIVDVLTLNTTVGGVTSVITDTISQYNNTVTVGVDDTGYDVKFFGASAGAYMLYDESLDQLIVMGASADSDASTGKLLLATSLTNINASDVLGKIEFQAPHEAGGTDAITVAAAIDAVAQGTFSASVNSTDLIFRTGHSELATEKFRFTSQGELGVGGANYGTDGQVLTSGGAGVAPAWEDAVTSLTAGTLIDTSGTTINVDLSEANAATIANGDYIIFLDGGTSSAAAKGDIHDIANLFAGTGLTASSSVIGVDASQTQITAVGTIATGEWNGDAIASTYIAADAITGAKIADDAIDSEHYTDGSIDTAHIADDQITLAKMASGTDGNIISYDASGNPVAIATGNDGQVLTSTGAGSPPAFEDAAGGSSDTVAANVPSDGAVSGVTAQFVPGEVLDRGEVVYFKQSDSKMWKAVASAEATSRCVAMAAEDMDSSDVSGGTAKTFLMMGFCTDNSTFPDYSASSGVGKPVYTPEAETSSQNVPEKTPPDSDGDFVQVIGFVHSANTLYFNPSQDIIEHA